MVACVRRRLKTKKIAIVVRFRAYILYTHNIICCVHTLFSSNRRKMTLFMAYNKINVDQNRTWHVITYSLRAFRCSVFLRNPRLFEHNVTMLPRRRLLLISLSGNNNNKTLVRKGRLEKKKNNQKNIGFISHCYTRCVILAGTD